MKSSINTLLTLASACLGLSATGCTDTMSGEPDHERQLWGSTFNGLVQEFRSLERDGTTATYATGALPRVEGVNAAAYDPRTGRYAMLVRETITVQSEELIVFQMPEGTLTTRVALQPSPSGPYAYGGGIHFRNDGKLVGVTNDGVDPASDYQMRIIEFDGTSTEVARVVGLRGASQNKNGYCRSDDVIYVHGVGEAMPGVESDERLFIIDASNGLLVRNLLLEGPAVGEFYDWSMRPGCFRGGIISGAYRSSTGIQELRLIDAMDGSSQPLLTLDNVQGVASAASLNDEATSTFYAVVLEDLGNRTFRELISLDLETNEVTARVTLDQPSLDPMFYNWSGGLYLEDGTD